MAKKNFKLRLSFLNELYPGKQIEETTNQFIRYANNGKDCLHKAIKLVKEMTAEATLNEVKITQLQAISIHELKKDSSGNLQAEAVFFWKAENEDLPDYDPVKIIDFFDDFVKKYTKP